MRQRGWLTILRAAHPHATSLRLRDVQTAYFAGAGLNGVLPARGGDVVKLALLHRRIPDSSYATLAATFVPETLFETLCGAALVIWALSLGLLPGPGSPSELPSLDVSTLVAHPSVAAIGADSCSSRWFFRRLFGARARGFLRRAARGLAHLRSPRRFLTGVASWQALGRLICFGLARRPDGGLWAAGHARDRDVCDGRAGRGTRVIPIAPASSGVKLLLLSYGLSSSATARWTSPRSRLSPSARGRCCSSRA